MVGRKKGEFFFRRYQSQSFKQDIELAKQIIF